MRSIIPFFLLWSSQASAAVITVDCLGSPGSVPTISMGVAAAAPGDTVVVFPCTYNENVVISAKNDLHLVAAKRTHPLAGGIAAGFGAVVTPPVIVDGTGWGGHCIWIDNSVSVSVKGFMLRNCAGGGIFSTNSFNSVMVANRAQTSVFGFGGANDVNTQIISNLARGNRIGISLDACADATVADNRASGNWRGIFLNGRNLQVVNNEANSNTTEGIYSDTSWDIRIERNTALGNAVGGGIYLWGGVTNADVIGNNTGVGNITNLGVGTDLAQNM